MNELLTLLSDLCRFNTAAPVYLILFILHTEGVAVQERIKPLKQIISIFKRFFNMSQVQGKASDFQEIEFGELSSISGAGDPLDKLRDAIRRGDVPNIRIDRANPVLDNLKTVTLADLAKFGARDIGSFFP